MIKVDYNLSMFLADTAGCGYYRCSLPGMFIEERGHANVKQMMFHSDYVSDWSDIVVIQRCFIEEGLDFVKKVKNKGKKVVYELDDDLFSVSKNSPAYMTFHKKNFQENAKRIIAECDAVTCSTAPLAKVLGEFNPNVTVLPNSLDFRHWARPYFKKEKPDNDVLVGWYGSATHYDDLVHILPAIQKLMEKDVKFVFFNYMPPIFREKLGSRVSFVSGTELLKFPSTLFSLGIDIGLCPCDNNIFNDSKSNLKFLEFSASKTCTVASNNLPYSDTIKHGETGYLVDNSDIDGWVNTIDMLVKDKETRIKIRDNAYNYVYENYSMLNNYKFWHEYYKSLIN